MFRVCIVRILLLCSLSSRSVYQLLVVAGCLLLVTTIAQVRQNVNSWSSQNVKQQGSKCQTGVLSKSQTVGQFLGVYVGVNMFFVLKQKLKQLWTYDPLCVLRLDVCVWMWRGGWDLYHILYHITPNVSVSLTFYIKTNK